MKHYDNHYTQNRELSWLKFNERVLEEADDKKVPLLERLKFISIFSSNLSEFFRIRCGSWFDLSLIDADAIDNKSGMTPEEQLDAIYEKCHALYQHRDASFHQVSKELQSYQVKEKALEHLKEKEEMEVHDYFTHHVLPLLSPQIIDIHHPFPHLINQSLYIMMILKHKKKILYALLPIPTSLPRIFFLKKKEGTQYLLIEKIILHYAEEVFSGYQMLFKTIISVTRNGDINLDVADIDEDEDYRQHMKKILKKRNRLAPIRLEIEQKSTEELTNYLCNRLSLSPSQVFISKTPLDMSYVFTLIEQLDTITRSQLCYEPFLPQPQAQVKASSIIQQLEYRDLLLHYPFHSMDPFLRLLKEAANDPNVISIKMTIYRLSSQSKIIKYLCEAAENGKDVTVLMELRARFDESNNINYAEVLEESGCRILYGFENYKVHSKICLITRKKGRNIEYITQIGSGNYNEKTSKMYTDLSYLTTREEIGKDAMLFFQNMAISNLQDQYQNLLVAPNGMKKKLLQLMDEEIEKAKNHCDASIIMKINSLTDRDMIDKLKEASCAGVKIKLIVRGICCLKPQIPKQTENIEIISIVGRFLEHSRIYCFGSDRYASIYISSADLMTRNMEKRVEIACPIEDVRVKKELLHILHVILNDNVKARKINSDGNYEMVVSQNDAIDSQLFFMNEAKKASRLQSKNDKEEHEINFWKKLFSHRKGSRS